MPNTTICQQTLQAGLREGSKRPNNHRKDPKEGQRCSKPATPLSLPMHGPETQHGNFGHYCNPQGHARPCSGVNVRHPEVLGGCRLFPEQSHTHKPNTLQQEQIWRSRRPFCNVFQNPDFGFPCLPVDHTNAQLLQATPKGTQLEVFHCCFKPMRTFGIQTAQHYQGKALLFHALVHRHLVCCLQEQVLSHLSQQSQIHIFRVPDGCRFLPPIGHPQYQKSSQKQNPAQHATVVVFLKRASQKYAMLRAVEHLSSPEKTPKQSPQGQSRCCVCWSRAWASARTATANIKRNALFSNKRGIYFCYCLFFTEWSY
jgi:hypothetical protein